MFAFYKIILSQSVVQHGRQRLFKFLIGQIQKRKKSSLKVRDKYQTNAQELCMAGPLQTANSVSICEKQYAETIQVFDLSNEKSE